jgi:hypothetical protein
MFTKIKKTKGFEYLQVVENYRDPDDRSRVRQRLVRYLGTYEGLDDMREWLKRERAKLRREATRERKFYENLCELPAIADEQRAYYKVRSERAAAAAEDLDERLRELDSFIEQSPGLLEQDRARVARVKEKEEEERKVRDRRNAEYRRDQREKLERLRELNEAWCQSMRPGGDRGAGKQAEDEGAAIYDSLNIAQQRHAREMDLAVIDHILQSPPRLVPTPR